MDYTKVKELVDEINYIYEKMSKGVTMEEGSRLQDEMRRTAFRLTNHLRGLTQ